MKVNIRQQLVLTVLVLILIMYSFKWVNFSENFYFDTII